MRIPVGAVRHPGARELGAPQWADADRGNARRSLPLRLPAGSLLQRAEMVIETLQSLRSLDYPNYEIQVLDDNTDDEALWRPVEAWCRAHDVKFVYLSDWPGFKSG